MTVENHTRLQKLRLGLVALLADDDDDLTNANDDLLLERVECAASRSREYFRLMSPLVTTIGERINEACSDFGLFGVRSSISPYRMSRERLEQIIELAQKAADLERERNEQRDRIRRLEAQALLNVVVRKPPDV